MQELINVAMIDIGIALNSNLVCSAWIMAGLSSEEKGKYNFDKANEIYPCILVIIFISFQLNIIAITANTLQHSNVCLAIAIISDCAYHVYWAHHSIRTMAIQ